MHHVVYELGFLLENMNVSFSITAYIVSFLYIFEIISYTQKLYTLQMIISRVILHFKKKRKRKNFTQKKE